MNRMTLDIVVRMVVVWMMIFVSGPSTVVHAVGSERPLQQADPVADFTGSPTVGVAPLSVSFVNNSTDAISYQWSYGDGTTSNTTEITHSHVYTQAGSYTVILQATNGVSVIDTLTQTAYVTVSAPAPVAFFDGNPISGDEPLTVTFVNSSTNASSYQWSYGDGTSSTIDTVTHTHIYTQSGQYSVELIANSGVLSATYSRPNYITINTPAVPQAEFGASPESGVEPLTVTFVNSSTNASNYSWDFGDGQTLVTSDLSPVSHTYNTAGSYTVSLSASNGTVTDTVTQSDLIAVNAPSQPPIAGFSATSIEGHIPLTITLSNNSSNANQYLWDFGDGQTSSEVNPTTVYTQAGVYVITLRASDGSVTDTAQSIITATEAISVVTEGTTWQYVKGISAPASNWTTTTFDDSGWSSGRSRFGTQTGNTILSDMVGGYSSLFTRHPFEISDPATVYGMVLGMRYEDGFIAYLNGTPVFTQNMSSTDHTATADSAEIVPQMVTFDLSEHIDLLQFGTNVLAIQGHNDDLNDANFNLSAELMLAMIDMPLLDLSVSSSAPDEFGQATTLEATIASGSGVSYEWDFGDGTTASVPFNPGQVVSTRNHTYSAAGTYTVVITASNAVSELVATELVTITTPAGLVITKGGTTTAEAGDPITYTLTITNYGGVGVNNLLISDTLPSGANYVSGGTLSGDIVTWGVPSLSAGADTSVTFVVTATETITNSQYEVSADGGLTAVGVDSVVTEISNSAADPILAAFEATPLTGPTPLSVTFLNQSSNATSYLWDFGDGTTSTDVNPTHIYTQAGAYTVTLQASNGVVTDTLTRPDYITPFSLDSPEALFSATPQSGDAPLVVTFVNSSTNATNYLWDFGDGNTSVAINPVYTYNVPGIYDVTLQAGNGTITDTFSLSHHVTAAKLLLAIFDPFPPSVNIGETVLFLNNSTGATSYEWDFGDGITTTIPSPTHTYSALGVYTVTLTASNDNASVSTTEVMAVTEPPQALFSGIPQSGDAPLTVTFVNSSTSATGYVWDFGDGNTSVATNPVHTYTSPGLYTVTLQAGNGSLTDTLSLPRYITVTEAVVAAFNPFPPNAQAGQTILFLNNSTGATAYEWDFGDGITTTIASPTHSYSTAGVYTVTLTAQNGVRSDVNTSALNILAAPPPEMYLTVKDSGTTFTFGSLSGVKNEDIISYDGTDFTMVFNGSAFGIEPSIDAFHIVDEDTILMSFWTTTTLPGGVVADEWDVVQFDATSLGEGTAGSFSLYFNGDDVGLDSSDEDLDALTVLPDGRLLISINGTPASGVVSGVRDEDVLIFTPISLGETTAGTWAMYFDSGDVELTSFAEGINGLHVEDNEVYFTTQGNFVVTGLTGADEDVGQCSLVSSGDTTACNYEPTLTFDGDAIDADFGALEMDGLSFAPVMVEDEVISGLALSSDSPSPLGQGTTFTTTLTMGTNISYTWNFGDGTPESTGSSTTSHTYSTVGSYTVVVTTSNSINSQTATKTVVVQDVPSVASFTTSSPDVFGDITSFTNTSTGSNLSYVWNFGDGSISITESPTHTYAAIGTYTVYLTTTNSLGSDVYSDTVEIIETPPTLMGYWSLDEDDSSRLDSSGNGNDLTDANTVLAASGQINQAADFEATNDEYLWLDEADQTDFDITSDLTLVGWVNIESMPPNDSYPMMISKYQYGSTNPSRAYRFGLTNNRELHFVASSDGTYDTKNRVDGQTALTLNQWYHVAAVFDSGAQELRLYVNGVLDESKSVDFTTIQTSIAPLMLGANMDDGAVAQHFDGQLDEWRVYAEALGQNKIQALMNEIYTPISDLTLTSGSPTAIGQSVPLTATVAAGDNISYTWDFGDNSGLTTSNNYLFHTYGAVGSYTVVVTASNSLNSQVATTTVVVQDAPSVASFTTSSPDTLGEAISFTNTSTGSNLSYSWNFGDGSISTTESPTHTYAAIGTYTVYLTTTNSLGSDFYSDTVEIVETPPTLMGYWSLDEDDSNRLDSSGNGNDLVQSSSIVSATGQIGDATDLEASNSEYLSIDDSIQTGLAINGDLTIVGWAKLESSPSGDHYVLASKYEWGTNNRGYRLTVNDGDYLTFVVSPDGAYNQAGNELVVTSTTMSVGDWHHIAAVFAGNDKMLLYQDGVLVANRDVTHSNIFTSTAPFMLGANLQNGNVVQHFDGQLDEWRVYAEALDQGEIQALMNEIYTPITGLTLTSDMPTPVGYTTTFTAAAVTGDNISYSWDFGDDTSTISNTPTVTHTYNEIDEYTVIVIASNVHGSQTATTTVIAETAPPIAAFTSSSPDVFNEATIFTNNSIGGDLSFAWNFGDGSVISTQTNPVHAYATIGTYTVILTATNLIGSDTITGTVVIQEGPDSLVAYWNFNELDTLDEGYGANLADTSTVGYSPGQAIGALDLERDELEYVEVETASNPKFNISGSLTLAGWVNAEREHDDRMMIASKYRYASGSVASQASRAYRLGINTDETLHFVVSPDGAYDTAYILDGTTQLTTDGTTWHHVAAVFDASAQELRLYVDGILDETKSVSFSQINISDAPFLIGANLRVNSSGNTVADQHFDGWLDEWQVFNTALSDPEIESLVEGQLDDWNFLEPDSSSDGGVAPLSTLSTVPTNFASSIMTLSAPQVTGQIRYATVDGEPRRNGNHCLDSANPCSLQRAVDWARAGDEVRVAAGTYTLQNSREQLIQILHIDKSIVVRGGYSTSDWVNSDPVNNPTILDAEYLGRAIYITGNDTYAWVEGLHLTRGRVFSGMVYDGGGFTLDGKGAGVYVKGSPATLYNNRITNNSVNTDGGGVYIDGSLIFDNLPALIDNEISGNFADTNGGGVYLNYSNALLSGNTIDDNRAYGFGGGGVYVQSGVPTLKENTIINNYTSPNSPFLDGRDGGGGVHLHNSSATLTQNFIWNNEAWDAFGAGVLIYGGAPKLEGNQLIENEIVNGRGGGIAIVEGSNATFNNTVVAKNRSDTYGSGIYIQESDPTFYHTTIASNDGGDNHGVRIDDYFTGGNSSNVTLVNTIIEDQGVGIRVVSGNSADVSGVLWGINNANTAGSGTLQLSGAVSGFPGFVDPANNDYHLDPLSAAVNAGVDSGLPHDIDGEPRPFDGAYDLGADEAYQLLTRDWRQLQTSTGPVVEGEHALAYDSDRDRVVMYGGNNTGRPYEESTWEFDGIDWQSISPATNPNARYGTAMAYDAQSDTVILFGGNDVTDTTLAETWQYDGATSTWTNLGLSSGPAARSYHSMTAGPNAVFLVGGNHQGTYYNDVWQFSNGSWQELPPASGDVPSARTLAGLAYDTLHDRLLLFGGRDQNGAFLDDIWAFNLSSSTWQQLNSNANAPVSRKAHSLVYDPGQLNFVLMGGLAEDGYTRLGDTWYYLGGNWVEATPTTALPPRAYHQAVYAGDKIVLYSNGEVWIYDEDE